MRRILLFSILLAPLVLISQPVIEISWSPVIGDEWKQSVTNELPDVSESGMNQIWDFSMVTLSADPTVIFLWSDPSTGINSECYEAATIGADLSVEGYGDGLAFGYYEQDQTSFKSWGESSMFGSKTIYSDPLEFRFIGLEYGENVSDEYASTTTANGFETYGGGQTIYAYDAYGTVKLPQASFNDVVRINQLDVSFDTFEVGGLIDVTLDSLHSIAYMAEGSIFPIALWQRNVSYTKTYINGTLLDSVFDGETLIFSINPDFGISTAVENSTLKDDTRVYPTVASTQLLIENVKAGEAIFLSSELGIVLKKVVADINITQIDVSNLQNGHYFILDSSGQLIDRFIKQN